jgi:hypothetical protein
LHHIAIAIPHQHSVLAAGDNPHHSLRALGVPCPCPSPSDRSSVWWATRTIRKDKIVDRLLFDLISELNETTRHPNVSPKHNVFLWKTQGTMGDVLVGESGEEVWSRQSSAMRSSGMRSVGMRRRAKSMAMAMGRGMGSSRDRDRGRGRGGVEWGRETRTQHFQTLSVVEIPYLHFAALLCDDDQSPVGEVEDSMSDIGKHLCWLLIDLRDNSSELSGGWARA